MRVAVIPARGGSKRIPKKNIKNFYGKPMIAWSINAALESELFDEVLVSTDNEETAIIAKDFGALVPFVRPAKLSDDFASTTEVISHSVQWMLDAGYHLDAVCCIYATAPFINKKDLQESLKVFNKDRWEYVFTASEFASPIFRAFTKNEDDAVEMVYPDFFNSRSQDLTDTFHDAGQFYWGRPSAWLENKKIFSPHSSAFVIPRYRVQDIDSDDDWKRAEIIAPLIFGAGN